METSNEIHISVFEMVGDNAAITSDSGDLLFSRIDKALEKKALVVIDFLNINLIVSTFLNASIGQLYYKHNSEFLNKHLKIENMSKEDLFLLKKVTQRAKEYFENKKSFDETLDNLMENE